MPYASHVSVQLTELGKKADEEKILKAVVYRPILSIK